MPKWNDPFQSNELLAFMSGYNAISDVVLRQEIRKGWVKSGEQRDLPTCIALMHSELSEALEADRKNLQDDKLPQYDGVTVELADAIIRIIGVATERGLPVGAAIVDKIAYNENRHDHSQEDRAGEHGKKY